MKYISVPISWALYKVPDETFQVLANGSMTLPPQVVLETMVFNGDAERMATIGSMHVNHSDDDEVVGSEDEEDPKEGEGPWYDSSD
jgi:hypothetical protein